MDKYHAIILFGPPGIGKGTQARLLAEKPGYFHFSSGEMFRDLDVSTELGARVRSLIDSGNYIDDLTTIGLAQETLYGHIREGRFRPEEQYLVLDGLPRTVPQVGLLNEFCDILQVLCLYVHNENVAMERLTQRARKEGRADDAHEETIRKRLRVFREMTEPALAEYDASLLRLVNSSTSIEEVQQRVWEVIVRKESKSPE